jgi:glycosyltransferase involved in cell wall biosynthesis
MNNIKISAVIITLNEEKNIQECIDSLKDVVDEIVVVDSFSTDKTEVICRNNGVKFLQNKWDGYGQQKNWGAIQATNDYILSIDADERLSDELKTEILNIKKDCSYHVYSFNRLTVFNGRAMKHVVYPDRQLRLFDKRKTKWNENAIHEKIIINKDIKVKRINKNILHFANQNIYELVDTLNKYSSLSTQNNFSFKKLIILKLIFSPIFSFVRNYFFKMGFLDGIFGLITCIIMAHYRFLKYAKSIEEHKKRQQIKQQ